MSVNVCKECQQGFDFPEGEQAYFQANSLAPPKRCPECREKRRKFGSDRAYIGYRACGCATVWLDASDKEHTSKRVEYHTANGLVMVAVDMAESRKMLLVDCPHRERRPE